MGYGLIGYGSWVMGYGLRVAAGLMWFGSWVTGLGSGHDPWVIGVDIDMGGLQRAPIDKLAGE